VQNVSSLFGRVCKSDSQSLLAVLVDCRKQRTGTVGRIGKPKAIYVVPAADDLQRTFRVRARRQLKRKRELTERPFSVPGQPLPSRQLPAGYTLPQGSLDA